MCGVGTFKSPAQGAYIGKTGYKEIIREDIIRQQERREEDAKEEDGG
jgi:hypothetical protein